jgi:hypothetical protein
MFQKASSVLRRNIGAIQLFFVTIDVPYRAETLQSLQFALRARKVEKGKAKINRA